ncbi:hypothetical protein MnTg02_01857 [bacterium MnTg02]|nr:hypothetical protein MnTg02_01857 [bacterium MnTg02]
MQLSCALNRFKLALNGSDARLNGATVRLDLCFARSAEKTKTAALTFKMGPAAHQSAFLVRKMRKFDLQPPFPRSCPASKNLEDQSGSIEHFDRPGCFKIALLNRRERMVDNNKLDVRSPDDPLKLLDFAGSKKRCRTNIGDRNQTFVAHIEGNGLS